MKSAAFILLRAWKSIAECSNNDETLQKAALVKVNNKEVAVFKYGEEVIGE